MTHAIPVEKFIRFIKCDYYEYATDSNNILKRHEYVKHECEFSTTSQNKLKKHKKTQYPPDDLHEEQAFKKA